MNEAAVEAAVGTDLLCEGRVRISIFETGGGRLAAGERASARIEAAGAALGLRASDIEIEKYERGGVGLKRPRGRGVAISSASTVGRFVAGVGRVAGLGVDIERREIRSLRREMAEIAMSEAEQAALAEADDYATLFFDLWCRKEAVLKAHGMGIACDLRRVCTMSGQCVEGWKRTTTPDGAAWFVRNIGFHEGYSLAVAADRPCGVEIRVR